MGCGTATNNPGKCPQMWRIWGHFSGFEGVDVTCGTRSRIWGHISARACACMIHDRSAFFRTLFGLVFTNLGLLHTFFGLCAHFGTHLGLVRGIRNAFGAALELSDPTNSLHFSEQISESIFDLLMINSISSVSCPLSVHLYLQHLARSPQSTFIDLNDLSCDPPSCALCSLFMIDVVS